MARSTVAQSVQIGVEATPGTAVPAGKRLSSLSVDLSPRVDAKTFRPKGTKYPTVVAPNREWAEGALTGQPTYDEVIYPLAGVFGEPTVAEVLKDDEVTPSGAYLWTYSPQSSAADTPVTFTVEQGDADVAERAAFVLFTDFGLEISRSEISISGTAIARAVERGVTLTPGPLPVAQDLAPILPGQVCVYAADTPATLGQPETKITNGLKVSPSVSGKYGAVWFLDCSQDSYSGFTEGSEPDAKVGLTVEADASGVAWADLFRAGTTRFLRIEATGALIDPATTGSRYRLTWDLAVKVLEPGAYSDEDGVYAIAPNLQVVHDPTWGKAMTIEVVNTVQAL